MIADSGNTDGDGLGRARPRAMVIEDSCVIALDLEALLDRELGCEVRICSVDPARAMAEIADFEPHLVISDLSVLVRCNLPLESLEAAGRGLIVVTGDTQAAGHYAAEGREILIKPYCLPEVARKAREVLARSAVLP
jgi:hypothetical protein